MQLRINHYELKYEFVRLRLLGYNESDLLGYFNDIKNERVIEFRVEENLEIITQFSKIVHFVSLTSRREKFLRVYRVFEELHGKPELSWRSVRVSISHSASKVTEKPIVEYLLSNFGELDISFMKNNQVKLFYKLFGELVEATYSLLLERLKMKRPLPMKTSHEISAILNSMRAKYITDSQIHSFRLGAMVHYGDLEQELIKYVPHRLMNPLVIWK